MTDRDPPEIATNRGTRIWPKGITSRTERFTSGTRLRAVVLFAVAVVLLRAPPVLAQDAACPPPGLWEVVDPSGETVITSITLGNDGRYQGGPWGRDFGGPNGLGANRTRCENGLLEFIYAVTGRERVDVMLSGPVRSVAAGYLFQPNGGYYGGNQSGIRHVEFLLRAPSSLIPKSKNSPGTISRYNFAPQMDCRLAGRWQSGKGDDLAMSGQLADYDGHLQSSGGTFTIRDNTGYSVRGGFRYDNGVIHFVGTGQDGQNKDWRASLSIEDGENPQSVFLNNVAFGKIEPGECRKGFGPALSPLVPRQSPSGAAVDPNAARAKLEPGAAQRTVNISGEWKTYQAVYGDLHMTLRQAGTTVSGTLGGGGMGGRIEGSLVGNVLEGTFLNVVSGSFKFQFSPDGSRFQGSYRLGDAGSKPGGVLSGNLSSAQEWSGRRLGDVAETPQEVLDRRAKLAEVRQSSGSDEENANAACRNLIFSTFAIKGNALITGFTIHPNRFTPVLGGLTEDTVYYMQFLGYEVSPEKPVTLGEGERMNGVSFRQRIFLRAKAYMISEQQNDQKWVDLPMQTNVVACTYEMRNNRATITGGLTRSTDIVGVGAFPSMDKWNAP